MNKNLITCNKDQSSESRVNNKISHRFRLLVKVGIIMLALVAAVALPSLAAFPDHRQSKQTAAGAKKEETGEKLIDLVPVLKNKQYREGLNHVYTESDGVRLSVRVKEGKIAEWIVTDKNGKVIPSTYSTSAKKKQQCILCYADAKTGKKVCRLVLCDSIIVRPVGGTKQA